MERPPRPPSLLRLGGAFALLLALTGCGDTIIQQYLDPDAAVGEGRGDGGAGNSDPDAAPTVGARCERDNQCDDTNACNGIETCTEGVCVAGDPVTCDDGIACTRDRCDPFDGSCVHQAPDADGDGEADARCTDAEGRSLGDDCDDDDPERFPGNTEVCDLEAPDHDEDCNPETYGRLDRDGDGFDDARCVNVDPETGDEYGGTDCDDGAQHINPATSEVCNYVDDNCNGDVDEGLRREVLRDADGDGVGVPVTVDDVASGVQLTDEGWIVACKSLESRVSDVGTDCDDTDPHVSPLHPELCDGIDNDCNDLIDDDVVPLVWYPDADGDGHGNPLGKTQVSCAPLSGFALRPDDCDDGDSTVHPGAPELCDGKDNDCDASTTYYLASGDGEDDDEDGYGDAACGGGARDCDDEDPFTHPGALEICDGKDNDCNGVGDVNAVEVPWYPDEDRDGHGDPTRAPIMSCEKVPFRVLLPDDCNDDNPRISPDARDDCSGIHNLDDDCDGEIDEAEGQSAFFRDDDGDGVGAGNPVLACTAPSTYVKAAGDCDDADPARSPKLDEVCTPGDGVDDDCDLRIDCEDPDCVDEPACSSDFGIAVLSPSEPLVSYVGHPIEVTVEVRDNAGTPTPDAAGTVTCAGGAGALPASLTSDGNGQASFTFYPGLVEGDYRCTVRLGAANPKTLVVEAVAPPDGTVFSALNAVRTTSIAGTPGTFAPLIAFNQLRALAAAPDGSLFVGGGWNGGSFGDWRFRGVLRLQPDGQAEVFAGVVNTGAGSSGDSGPATDANFREIHDLAWDETAQRLYIYDHDRVRYVNAETGVIRTLLGGGGTLLSLGQTASLASVSLVAGASRIALIPGGGLVIGNWNGGILHVPFDGTVRRLACPDAPTAVLNAANGLGVLPTGQVIFAGTVCGTAGIGRIDLESGTVERLTGITNTLDSDGVALGATDLGTINELEIDPAGGLLLARNSQVLRVDPNSLVVTAVIGSPTAGDDGDYGPAGDAHLDGPTGIAPAVDGGLWIAEWAGGYGRLRRVWGAPDYEAAEVEVSVASGNGQSVYPGSWFPEAIAVEVLADGEPVDRASVEVESDDLGAWLPGGSTDPGGIYPLFAASGARAGAYTITASIRGLDGSRAASTDANYAVQRPPVGTITTLANLPRSAKVLNAQSSPRAATTGIGTPEGLTVGDDGTVYANTRASNQNTVLAISPEGVAWPVVAGSSNAQRDAGPALQQWVDLSGPDALAIDDTTGILYVGTADRVHAVDLETGVLSTVAGLGGETAGGSPALETATPNVSKLALDADGVLHVMLSPQARLFQFDPLDPNATISHLLQAVNSCQGQPNGQVFANNTNGNATGQRSFAVDAGGRLVVAAYRCVDGGYWPSGGLWEQDEGGAYPRLDTGGGSTGDGPLPIHLAQVWPVQGMDFDADGNLYLATGSDQRIRMLTPDGTLTTLAGTVETAGDSGDGGPAVDALLSNPTDVAVTPEGDLVLSDSGNHAIRKIWMH